MAQSVTGFGYAKALIFGEYAVMYGAPGLVMGLSATLHARLSMPPLHSMSPFETRLAKLLQSTRSIDCDIALQNDAFFDDTGHKLGIGSSAAASVAVLKAASLLDNRPFSIVEAIQFHRALQNGVGSGIDVIASALGGFVLARNCPDAPQITRIPSQNLPSIAIFASHHEAPTRDFVAAAHKAESTRPFKLCMEKMHELCEDLARSAVSGQKITFLEQIEALCALLNVFGNVINMPVVPAFFQELRTIADDCHVTIKPSGAGGGDIFLAMALDDANLEQFAQAIPAKFSRIPFSIADLRN